MNQKLGLTRVRAAERVIVCNPLLRAQSPAGGP